MTPHATLIKFGHPTTLIRDLEHWSVLLRPQQVTLGALVLAARGEERSFAELAPEAFAELKQATTGLEAMLGAFRPFERINYVMLMMVDPHVHFHVLPRYSSAQTHEGLRFPDAGWPGPPDLKSGVLLDAEQRSRLTAALKALWPVA